MRNGGGGEENDWLNGVLRKPPVQGFLRKFPVLKSKQLGKLGPGFGLGAGCGIGLGIGLTGGVGFGPLAPGLQLVVGYGAGCGVGFGFGYGYGIGRVRGYEGNRLGHLPSQDEIGSLIDELAMNTKKLVQETSKMVEKWGRF